jgi:predicted RNA binding protein YcfA (HicA-like mRNA interferase family)
MGKCEKLLLKILHGSADASILFDDLRTVLKRLGFEERIRGSHHVFRKQGIVDKIVLQRDGSKAKAYQVHQVRNVIVKYNLSGE